ncbi:hypothetical protein DVR12_26735 [Chitinophaga silvatica]|uniref:Uncharacterized protein n=1 Tax=Chitinophaga silvatica TaxID=2282649 RepID=A0A3E1Y298_9BACT|nr:hypothetical protein [Chitinophaga silvatica]RFS18798.1 hypothetical protein DVR12_26735 [Chitinophaga silvatica]
MKQIWENLKYPLYLILVVIFIFSKERIFNLVFPPGKKYGVAFNAERKRLGIDTLPATWTTKDKYKTSKIWYPPNRQDSGSFRDDKMININSGKIIYEGDTYKHIVNGQVELLTIEFKYETSKWGYKYYNETNATSIVNLTKIQSDSILQSWGLKH